MGEPAAAAAVPTCMRYAGLVLLGLAIGIGAAELVCGGGEAAPVSTEEVRRGAEPDAEQALRAEPVLRGCARPAKADDEATLASWRDTVLVKEEDLPEDPLEHGSCALELEFVHAVTGEPLETAFDLWRLGAPGNADWTAGDQRQVDEHRKVSATRVERLPAGRYRLHVHGARKGAPDPPAFEVVGPLTLERVLIDAPVKKPVALLVFDERGNLLREAEREFLLGGSSSSQAREPDWVETRRLTGRRRRCSWGFWMGHGDAFGRGRREPVTAESVGFSLSSWVEPTRYSSWSALERFHLPERSSVRTFVSNRDPHARFHVGLSVPLAWIRERAVLQDGRPITDTDLEIRADCRAVRLEPGADPWAVAAALTIEVRGLRDGKRVVRGEMVRTSRFVRLAPIYRP